MNEYGEVLGRWFIRTDKLEELEYSIKRLKKTYELNDFYRPVIVYCDQHEMDRSTQDKIFGNEERNDVKFVGKSLSNGSTDKAEYLHFPTDNAILDVTYKGYECSTVINRIRKCLDVDAGRKVLDFDLEWSRGCNPAATLQHSIIEVITWWLPFNQP